MRYRLLALDVDGTLAWRGDEVLPATRRALHLAAAAGVHVAIATGRRYRTTRRVIDALGLPVPAVSLGGALVKDGRARTLHEVPFAAPELRAVVAALREAGLAPVGQRDHADGGADFVVDGHPVWNGWTARYVEANRAHMLWSRDLLAEERSDVLVVGAFGERAVLERAERTVRARMSGACTTVVTPLPARSSSGGGCYLEVAGAGACKWQGLSRLAAHLRVAPEAICAVGDERNDLTMIRGAGLGVAMGNAPPQVQAAADHVTGRHDEDGLVAVVEHILG